MVKPRPITDALHPPALSPARAAAAAILSTMPEAVPVTPFQVALPSGYHYLHMGSALESSLFYVNPVRGGALYLCPARITMALRSIVGKTGGEP